MKLIDVLSIIRIDRILIKVVKAVFGGGKKGGESDDSEAFSSKKSKK